MKKSDNMSSKRIDTSKIPDFGILQPTHCHRCGKRNFKEEDTNKFRRRWVCEHCGQAFNYNARRSTIVMGEKDGR
jgi:transposase-like protein